MNINVSSSVVIDFDKIIEDYRSHINRCIDFHNEHNDDKIDVKCDKLYDQNSISIDEAEQSKIQNFHLYSFENNQLVTLDLNCNHVKTLKNGINIKVKHVIVDILDTVNDIVETILIPMENNINDLYPASYTNDLGMKRSAHIILKQNKKLINVTKDKHHMQMIHCDSFLEYDTDRHMTNIMVNVRAFKGDEKDDTKYIHSEFIHPKIREIEIAIETNEY